MPFAPLSALPGVRHGKRRLADLLGTYAVMIEQYARERAEAMAESDESLAARDDALGVTVLNPSPQRAAHAGRTHGRR
ncbi:hypothetical protein ACFYPN_21040 [Streptomyces sp. NPDC005576]|uniref:hypothetical protein n=1 Tax=unclassified Streptomyces TaxID=2593676 RepID=UPI0033F9E5A4